jgi:hypothetical protein
MATFPGLSTHRPNVREQVRRHPLVVFAVLAYAITWIAWPLNNRFDLGIVNGFGIVSLAGPALAAVIVSALVKPEPSGVPVDKHWRSFGMIGLLALAVMSIVRLCAAAGLVTLADTVANPVAYPGFPAFLGDGLAAAVVAFIFSGVHSTRKAYGTFCVRSIRATNQFVGIGGQLRWDFTLLLLCSALLSQQDLDCRGQRLHLPVPGIGW